MKQPCKLVCGVVLSTLLIAVAALADPTVEWTDLYDGGAGLIDEYREAIVDGEGNLIVAGESTDTQGGSDFFIRKLRRSDGGQIWGRRFPAEDDSDMAITGLNWDPFGSILVGGYVRGCVG